jgi:hypothetical protein
LQSFFSKAVAGAFYFRTRQTAHRLTEKDTIVLADFANSTGDAVFDDTLKTALSVSLNQSPFLNVLPENKVSATLELMARPGRKGDFSPINFWLAIHAHSSDTALR